MTCAPMKKKPAPKPKPKSHVFEPGDGIAEYADICVACGRHLSEHVAGRPLIEVL